MKQQNVQLEKTGASYFSGTQSLTKNKTNKKTLLKSIVILAMLCIILPSQDIYGQTHTNATISGKLSFGSSSRQMIDLWSTTSHPGLYGIGVQSSTQYFRTRQNFAWYKGGTHSNSALDAGTNGTVLMALINTGRLGLGTTTPQGNLHVSSGTSGDAILRLDADTDNNNESDNPRIELRQDGDAIGVTMGFDNNFGGNNFGIARRWSNANHYDTFVIDSSNGNIGIGEKPKANVRLAVDGKIEVRSVEIHNVGWADFVFYDDYKLPTLEEVEQHIEEKGHLKDIPSAEEVLKNGTDLGEIDALLLQKIEELTLYLIEQNKQLKTQNKRLKVLEQENTVLKKKIGQN